MWLGFGASGREAPEQTSHLCVYVFFFPLRAFCSSLRMNGNQKLEACNQDRQDFIQHFSQIVKVLTEDELGHPETGDAITRLKEVRDSGLKRPVEVWILHGFW